MVSSPAPITDAATHADAARLVGLDWGSTSLRAFLFDEQGVVLDTRVSPDGASTLKGHPAFAAALDRMCGDWFAVRPDLPLVACGMVGSQHGWREAPYVPCPAQLADLASSVVTVDGTALRILPGLRTDGRVPDVMRGEETQIVGAIAVRPDLAARSCVVLPGTHSKWATVANGRVQSFVTFLTGELYALLRHHSVLARLMPSTDDAASSLSASSPSSSRGFLSGVKAAREGGHLGLSHQLFGVRTLGLFDRMPADELPDYLSGLLIGHEIAAGLRQIPAGGTSLALVGAPALCERYAAALASFDLPRPISLDNTAPTGLWQLARRIPALEMQS